MPYVVTLLAPWGKKRPDKTEPLVKPTLRRWADLWREARVRALNERIAFRDIVARALRRYLTTTKGGGE